MLKNITFECSLKPFKKTDDAYIRAVAEKIFTQWRSLIADVPCVSVMLWTADGSEILDYDGDMDRPLEWGRYAGSANTRATTWYPARDPNREGLHSRSYLYCDEPPVITYGTLRRIVSILREVGQRMLGEGHTVRVGETFDSGPEFANSTFKYVRHPEICCGSSKTMSNFVCANSRLHADTDRYAAFPDGIPEGTPLGTFLGRQAEVFLGDMGFDFLWLSNGFGFGRETWSTTGSLFDGKKFHTEDIDAIREDVLSFWRYFRAECPTLRVETRGTNLSVGIDYARDGVPLYDIYHGGFNILPPPNSPWAALDGDFGLELMGYLSRIADLPPEEEYLFRYYIHDPWWVNSPWYDRYQGQPHDIYMPLACARIDGAGKVQGPTHMGFLSIDNTYGEMPECCVNEPLPHLQKALKDAPDAPSPLVWVYPFREYSTATDPAAMRRMFAGDWFVRGAVNHGLPLATVISTDNFLGVDKAIFARSVLLVPVPEAGSAFEKEIISYVEGGGKVLFYGTTADASAELLALLGLANAPDGITGEIPVSVRGRDRGVIRHSDLIGAGKITTLAVNCRVLACSGRFALATLRGTAGWVRGNVSSDYVEGARLLAPQDETKYFPGETLAREVLSEFGWTIRFDRDPGQRSPVVILSRSDNALWLSSYLPSTTVKTTLRTPLGAPVFLATETKLEKGCSTYWFPKAEHKECRFFVDGMEEGILSARELPPVSFIYRRRIGLYGLRDATVRIFGEEYCKDDLTLNLNGVVDEYTVSDPIDFCCVTDENGTYFEARHVTGNLVVSMKRPSYKPQPLSEADAETTICDGVPDYL